MREPRERPALKGPPLPKLSTLLADPATSWQRITAPLWYGKQIETLLEITSGTALWYRPGTPPRPIRWVLVRDPAGKRAPQAFLSTDTALEPAEIIAIFVRRWQVEVTFSEVRAHLGVETQRQWSDKAIRRTTPVLMGLYSIVVLWGRGSAATRRSSLRRRLVPEKRLHLLRRNRRRLTSHLDGKH